MSLTEGTLVCPNAVRRVAAIDIGTVTCRMLVADVDDEGALHELAREYAIANLGEGVDATHRLKPEAIERVASIIERYLDKLHVLCGGPTNPSHLVPRIVAIATSASRDADNAADFTERMHELGVDVQVIPGEREASLSFAGATAEFPGDQVVVIDVGGGSTEVVAGTAGGDPAFIHSFNVGCRRVTERFLKSDPPAEEEIARAQHWIEKEMSPYLQQVRDGFSPNDGFSSADEPASNDEFASNDRFSSNDGPSTNGTSSRPRLVAVAGTATTMVSIREKMAVYDSSRVHKANVTSDDIAIMGRSLAAMPLEERRRVIGLDPDRAPVIVAGCLILQTAMNLLGASSFTVSESDILQGIVLRMTTD